MSQNWIVDGDCTDHGGTVIVPSCMITIDGRNVATTGDKVQCPKCNVMAYILDTDNRATIQGRTIAKVGGLTSCGARLMSIKQSRVYFGDGRADDAILAAEDIAAPEPSVTEEICEPCLDEARQRSRGVVNR